MAVPFRTPITDEQAALELQRDPGYLQASDDPFEATAQTVEYMCQLITDSLADGIVQNATVAADHEKQFLDKPWASIWWWAKRHMKFVHHQKLLVAWLNAPDELQLLIRPDVLLKMQEPKGDCAVYTTLICAMLDCAGLAWEIVTVAVDPRQPGIFSHVYPRVILESGQRVPLDASHGKYPGWEVPAEHMSAKQIWDMNGTPIQDVAPGRFQGLHGYLYGGRDRMGLGQDDGDDGGDDSGDSSPTSTDGVTGATNPIVIPAVPAAPLPPLSSLGTPTVGSGPAPGSSIAMPTSSTGSTSSTNPLGVTSAIASDISALAAGATQVAKIVTGQTTTPITISSTTVLWLVGGAVGLIVLLDIISAKGKR
jgi:hypothetical protein